MLRLPLLARYRFYVKVDSDIIFTSPFPFDLGQRLGELASVKVAHTGLQPGWLGYSCNAGVIDALDSFGRMNRSSGKSSGPRSAASRGYSWCRDPLHELIYGNFVAFATDWVRSSEIQELSSYLYHDRWAGYLRTRWTDQAPYMAFVCHTLAIPDILKDTPQVVHLTELRNRHFRHKHWDHQRPAVNRAPLESMLKSQK